MPNEKCPNRCHAKDDSATVVRKHLRNVAHRRAQFLLFGSRIKEIAGRGGQYSKSLLGVHAESIIPYRNTHAWINLMKSQRQQILLVVALLMFHLVVSASASSILPQIKPEALYKAALPSIMTLKVTKSDGTAIQGSAFMLADSGIAATAWHLVDGAKEVSVRFSDGEEFEVSGLIDKDEKRDLALIRVKAFGRPQLKTSTSNPEVGSRAFVIGAPRGLEFTISEGLVSQIQQIEGMKQYQFSSPASPGNSGGPLLNDTGEVIGVVSWQLTNGQNLNFAIPSSYLLGLDKSLPTTPWTAVRTTVRISDSPGSGVRVTDEKADELLSETYRALVGTEEAVNYQIRIEHEKGSFQLGIDTWFYSAQRELNSLTEQIQRTSMESQREEFKRDLLAAIKISQEAMKYLADAVQLAQQFRWTPTANDLLKKGFAANEGAIGATLKLRESPTWKSDSFQKHFPPTFKTGNNQSTALGLTVYFTQPQIVSSVAPRSLGEKLGIKPLDSLYLPLKTVEVDLLVKWKGKKVQFNVIRLGQQVKLKGDIPKAFAPDPVKSAK
jgi:S1-C subfamily serine protease